MALLDAVNFTLAMTPEQRFLFKAFLLVSSIFLFYGFLIWYFWINRVRIDIWTKRNGVLTRKITRGKPIRDKDVVVGYMPILGREPIPPPNKTDLVYKTDGVFSSDCISVLKVGERQYSYINFDEDNVKIRALSADLMKNALSDLRDLSRRRSAHEFFEKHGNAIIVTTVLVVSLIGMWFLYDKAIEMVQAANQALLTNSEMMRPVIERGLNTIRPQ